MPPSNADPNADSSGNLQTLFDSPPDTENLDLPEEETVGLRLSLPEDRAQRLKAVAKQLGLTPSMVAERAIEMICEEVITTQNDQSPPHLHIEQYQARLDLLHAVQNTDEVAPEVDGTRDTNDPSTDEA